MSASVGILTSEGGHRDVAFNKLQINEILYEKRPDVKKIKYGHDDQKRTDLEKSKMGQGVQTREHQQQKGKRAYKNKSANFALSVWS